MREILFRGKRVDSNEWIIGNLIVHHYLDKNDELIENLYYITLGIGANAIQVHPETVGQFTGLTDVNGVRIFEGDVIGIKEFWNNGFGDLTSVERNIFNIEELKGKLHNEYISDVIYEGACFFVKSTPDYYDTSLIVLDGCQKNSQPIFESKIIGNIHDNPELAQS